MKATLEFNLPEEQEEHERAVKALDWAILVWDIDQKILGRLKYEDAGLSEEEYARWEEMRTYISEQMSERGLVFPT